MSNHLSVAVVTGASRGIGAAIAEQLARAGHAVIVNYVHSQDAAAGIVAGIAAIGGQAVAVQADVADPGGARTLFDAADRAFGGTDILVNNAGVMTGGTLAETSDTDYARQIDVNLSGTFHCLREGARRLRDGGRIINFSSSVVGLYQPGYGVYAATKAAIEAMTHVLAKELGSRRINVNAVAPGPVETTFFLNGKTENAVDAIVQMNPFKRLGQPEDIARVVGFLAGPESSWINGQVIRANGGMV